jgi:uncharacterized membrane protein (DUF485 family)
MPLKFGYCKLPPPREKPYLSSIIKKEKTEMHHGPAVKLEKCNAAAAKAKLGIYLFFVYLIVYGGFVAITLASPTLMNGEIIFGLNLACTYGFGLIILAIVMGLIYNSLCTRLEEKLNRSPRTDDSSGEER